MHSITAIEHNGRAFCFGKAVISQGTLSKKARKEKVFELANSNTTERYFWSDADVFEGQQAISVFKVLERLSGSAVYTVRLQEENLVYICEVVEGQAASGADVLLSKESSSESNEIKDRLIEAQQLVDQDHIYIFSNVESFFEFIDGATHLWTEKDWQTCELVKTKAGANFNLGKYAVLGLMAFVIMGGGYWGFSQVFQEKRPSTVNDDVSEAEKREQRRKNAEKMFEEEKSRFLTEKPLRYVKTDLKKFMSVPYTSKGFNLHSIDCDLAQCTYIYQRADDVIVTPAYQKLQSLINENAQLIQGGKRIQIVKKRNTASEPIRPHDLSQEEYRLAWSDFANAVESTGAKVTYSNATTLQGAEVIGETLKVGTWRIMDIDVGKVLPILDGISKLPGARYNQVSFIGSKFQIRGSYAIH